MLEIKVLGSGCASCKKLEELCRQVVLENNIDANIEKITDYIEIANLGAIMTPALIINKNLLVQGKLPVKSTLEHWILEADKKNN